MSRYGCKRSPPDTRDYKYHIRLAARIPPILPPSIDFRDKMTSVRNQGSEGSCVGFASVAMKEYQERLEWKKTKNLSERYVYEKAKATDGDPLPHEGTTIRAAMDVLYKRGVCTECYWKYVPNVTMRPWWGADGNAKKNRIASYVALDGVQHMKEALVSNGHFVIGIDVYESFDKADNGNIPLPVAGEERLGGHAVCIVGYNDNIGAFTFKNSWGRSWGDGGYGRLPYTYMSRHSYDGWLAVDLP